jgi:dynein heavy chain 2
VTIREAMQELVAWSQTAELKLTERVEGGRRTMLIRDWKELMLELGDKQSLLASLKESQFFKAFADQGATYESKLVALDQYLQMLNSIQRKWVYLEPIFARGSLPSEQAR